MTRTIRRFVQLALMFGALLPAPLRAQSIEDGIMLSRGMIFSGSTYSRETWSEYWEGERARTNDNIGTITTQAGAWLVNYGVVDRVNVIASMPYVWTRASGGVLHGARGAQDLTLAAKINAFQKNWSEGTFVRAIGVVAATLPTTDYNVELLPLSIGLKSKRLSWRGTVNVQTAPGWFVNGTTAWTARAAVRLDRPYYFTDDQFVMSDRAPMPDVFDYAISGGYLKNGVMLTAMYAQQTTLGGGDIRRQDMPFVSNRMNASRVGGMVMYPIPKLRRLAFQASYSQVVAGRNVGRARSVSTGFFYLMGSASR